MSCSEEADVLIVGGGPVGLTLAADLSFREVSTILLERNPTTSNNPKAFSLGSRSMEHFRRIGLEKKIQDAAYPRDWLVCFSLSTSLVGGKQLFKKMFSSWGDAIDDTNTAKAEFPFFQDGASPAFPMLCPQFTTEVVIRKHIEDTSKYARLCFGWSVTTISQDDNGVTVKAVNRDGEEKTFKGKYLAACDGGRSFVRRELGLHTYGHYVIFKACTISFSSPRLMEKVLANNTQGFAQIVNAQFMCLAILLNASGRFVTHIFLPSSTSDEKVKWYIENPDKCVEVVVGSSDIPYEIISVDPYNMHALVSTRYQEGRCFFAGDSAHQWLPVGGLGLNTGISDVADLSWKMAAMVKGYGGKYLLDSYEIERRPHADTSRRFAMSIPGGMMLGSSTVEKVRPFLVGNPITRFLVGKAAGTFLTRLFFAGIDVVLGFQYSNSSVIMHQYNEDGSVTPHCNIDCKFTPSSLPGCRAPHVVLPDFPSTVDLFGKRFVLLTVGGAEADLVELREAMTQKGVPFSAHTYPPLPELTQLYNRKYFLIRPDGIVAWRSDFQPSNAESLKIIATVLGHMPNPRLTPPIETFREPDTPAMRSFARDVTARLLVTGLLVKYTQVPIMAAGAVGLGIFTLLRAVSIAPPYRNVQSSSRHKAVVINKYGDADSVLAIDPKRVGKFGPEDVLIRVHASSITALDVSMRSGHGAICYQKVARLCFGGPYFPLVLGRDCSGEVVAVGDSVTKYLPGDLVFAAIPPHRQGAHAQLVGVHENHVAFKPSNVDYKEAASLPWDAMTVWSALVECAGLNRFNARGKKVLVHNGTSSVGSIAVQLLKAWGANVTTTCAMEDTVLAHHLGADKVLDDQTGDFSSVLSGYDIVLDTLGGEFECASLSILKYYQRSVYVATVSPHDKLVDSFGGFMGGLVFSTLYRLKVALNRLFGGRGFYYSSTEISSEGLDELRVLVEQGAVRPLINAVYSFDDVIAAHKHVEAGNTRGKVVISVP